MGPYRVGGASRLPPSEASGNSKLSWSPRIAPFQPQHRQVHSFDLWPLLPGSSDPPGPLSPLPSHRGRGARAPEQRPHSGLHNTHLHLKGNLPHSLAWRISLCLPLNAEKYLMPLYLCFKFQTGLCHPPSQSRPRMEPTSRFKTCFGETDSLALNCYPQQGTANRAFPGEGPSSGRASESCP